MKNNTEYVLGNEKSLLNKLGSRSLNNEASALLPFLNDARNILDAGCGTASITSEVACACPNASVVGIDIDEFQVQQVREKYREIRNLNFFQKDLHALDFDDDTFDLVFSHTVLMHLKDPYKALNELYRVCKPGGRIVLREGAGTLEILPGVSVGKRNLSLSEFLKEVLLAAGGTPNIGLKIKKLASAAGFSSIEYNVDAVSYSTFEELLLLKEWYQDLITGHMGRVALSHHIVSEEELLNLSQKIDMLPFDNSSISVVVWGEVVGVKE